MQVPDRGEGAAPLGQGPRPLGGPDDKHYATLGPVQPLEVTESWSPHWPNQVIYHLGESVLAIARCGLKGNPVRDLRKAAWLLSRAADILEGNSGA